MVYESSESSAVIADQIIEVFREKGDAAYRGEEVSQTEHALQAATAAQRDGADCELITAALLHDIGHLVHDLPEDCAEAGVDDCHQALGDQFLGKYFGLRVTDPVRLHVAAKRYLCTCDPDYREQLSPASVTSLRLQGGSMTAEEVAQYEAEVFSSEATQLRGWDDEAKNPQFETEGWEHFREPLIVALRLAVAKSTEPDTSPGKRE